MKMPRNSSYFIHNLVILFDFIIVNVVFSIFYYYELDNEPALISGVTLPFLLLLNNGSLAVSQMFFSNIIQGHYRAIDKIMRQVCLLVIFYAAVFISALATSQLFFDTPSPQVEFTLYVLGLSGVTLIVSRMLEYLLLKQFRRFGRNSRTVIFIGEARLIEDAYEDINLHAHAGLRVLGYYSDDVMPSDSRVKIRHLGTLNDLGKRLGTVEKRICDDMYCTDIKDNNEFISVLVDYCMRAAIQFNYIPPFLNNFGYGLKPRAEGEMIVFSNLNEPLQSYGNRLAKRAFDIVGSSIALVFIAPLIPIIGSIIKISSPGPIFFKQKRTGLNGEEFYMLKFRSMHVNKDADRVQATKNDPRKFAFGNFMRKTSIDELPQFINVLKGDMSIVGPRPHMLAHTDEYRKKIYDYMLRHLVRPGITGWAQVTGFRGETPELWQMEGRVQRDLWYIQNWSFWLDIRIIYRTVLLMFINDKNAF